MSPRRFCFFTTFYPPFNFGGDGVVVERLARALVARGCEVTVVHDLDAYRALRGGADPAVPEPDLPGLRVVSLESRLGRLSLLLTHQCGRPVVHARRIRRILRDGHFDVLTFHNVSLLGGPGLLSFGGDTPKIYMAHEHWLVCPTHTLWRHNRELCTGRQCLRCTLRYRRLPQLWRWTGQLRRQSRHVDTFIAMSEFSRRKHREFGFDRPMEVLPCFLPPTPPVASDASESSPHSRPYFLYVGRLERLKGVDDVLTAFEQYDGADLLIAGDGEYGPTLRRRASHNPRVVFLGRVERERLNRYYQHAMALIVPSVCYETFGVITLEAFQHRTPVIARRLGPLPDIVDGAGGGELFETCDELVSALARLQSDPTRRRALGDAGFRAYETHYSENVVVPRFLELVGRAIHRAGSVAVRAILTYHSIDDSGSAISVPASVFAQHVKWLRSGDVRVASIPELLALPPEADAVAITFDDGFCNFAVDAAPLLHGLPVTLFVVTDHVGRSNDGRPGRAHGIPTMPLLDWPALSRLAESGVILGSHSRTHADLATISPGAFDDELAGSAERLQRETGVAPELFVYPYGSVTPAAVAAVAARFRWACTTQLRSVGVHERMAELPRIDMYYFRQPRQLESWGTARFHAYLGARRLLRGSRRLAQRAAARIATFSAVESRT